MAVPAHTAALHGEIGEGRRQEAARVVVPHIVGDAVIDDVRGRRDEALRAYSDVSHWCGRSKGQWFTFELLAQARRARAQDGFGAIDDLEFAQHCRDVVADGLGG